ncbi:MAG: hypothetical protein IJT51_00665 [Bacteroidales bacterium]|nr:hypothetical protein [Bacteroidales bacterium]
MLLAAAVKLSADNMFLLHKAASLIDLNLILINFNDFFSHQLPTDGIT